jgi:MFS family permease
VGQRSRPLLGRAALSWNSKISVFGVRDFRTFYAGYVTSLLGSAMSLLAVAFAVLDDGGNATDLGLVMAAGAAPQVAIMLVGGVVADRFGRRWVMLGADVVRSLAQGIFAVLLFVERPQLWVFLLIAVVRGTAQAFFKPAFQALTIDITPYHELGNANAMLGLAQSVTRVSGPALAGVLVAFTSPAMVVAIDAATYGVSVIALGALRIPPVSSRPGRSFAGDLREGWNEFRAHPWLMPTTLQFTFINLVVWGPFLLLGPVLSRQSLGGPGAWGIIMAAYGAGCVAGGLLALDRRPQRPLVVRTLGTLGYGIPCALLAARAGLPAITAGALLAGTGSAVASALEGTVIQQQVPPAALARVSSIQSLGAFSASPIGLSAAGPIAAAIGIGTVLVLATAWGTVSGLIVLALPSIRRIRWVYRHSTLVDGSQPAARASADLSDGGFGNDRHK